MKETHHSSSPRKAPVSQSTEIAPVGMMMHDPTSLPSPSFCHISSRSPCGSSGASVWTSQALGVEGKTLAQATIKTKPARRRQPAETIDAARDNLDGTSPAGVVHPKQGRGATISPRVVGGHWQTQTGVRIVRGRTRRRLLDLEPPSLAPQPYRCCGPAYHITPRCPWPQFDDAGPLGEIS